MPVSGLPSRPGQSIHNQTLLKRSDHDTSVRRYAAISRSNLSPLSRSSVEETYSSWRMSWMLVATARSHSRAPLLPLSEQGYWRAWSPWEPARPPQRRVKSRAGCGLACTDGPRRLRPFVSVSGRRDTIYVHSYESPQQVVQRSTKPRGPTSFGSVAGRAGSRCRRMFAGDLEAVRVPARLQTAGVRAVGEAAFGAAIQRAGGEVIQAGADIANAAGGNHRGEQLERLVGGGGGGEGED